MEEALASEVQTETPKEQIPYMYVIVRTDIPFADQMVQIGHACQDSGALFGCPPNCHMVLGSVKSEQDLLKWQRRLDLEGVRYSLFYEIDDDMGYTCIATEPLVGDQRKPMKKLNLYCPTLPAA